MSFHVNLKCLVMQLGLYYILYKHWIVFHVNIKLNKNIYYLVVMDKLYVNFVCGVGSINEFIIKENYFLYWLRSQSI